MKLVTERKKQCDRRAQDSEKKISHEFYGFSFHENIIICDGYKGIKVTNSLESMSQTKLRFQMCDRGGLDIQAHPAIWTDRNLTLTSQGSKGSTSPSRG